MSFKTLQLNSCYESGIDNLIEDFYIPILENSVSYDRIAGFFSSTSLAISAKGILGLIKNNGRMRLITSPKLTNTDIEVFDNFSYEKEEILINQLTNEISEIHDTFLRDHIYALGWLLKHDLLEIKLAIVYGKNGRIMNEAQITENGLFHQKVGILTDEDHNKISFSGSINETAKGWIDNIEEFKVFKNWENGQIEFCEGDITKFEALWEDRRENVQIFQIPDAIRDHLVRATPDDFEDLLCVKKYRTYVSRKKHSTIDDLSLFEYQKTALKQWIDNDRKLIFEMATGTGKTRTAISCIINAFENNNPLIVIIACPQNTLLLQWKSEIENLKIEYEDSLIVDSTNPNWRIELESKLLDMSLGSVKSLIVYTTHATCCKNDFIEIINTYKKKSRIFFIGDEVHGLGATQTKRSLNTNYDYRLGLSATPRRWYDEIGTELLYSYFGNSSFEFTLKDALNTTNPLTNKPYLVNFYYRPLFTTLNEHEVEDYISLSKKITKLSKFAKKDDQYSELLENLIFKRANIHKSAENKYSVLVEILDSISLFKDAIIFVSPDQIDNVMSILSSRGIKAHEFTERQGTTPEGKFNGKTERQYLVEKFKEGGYQVLVAIKCLDEGIDIPSAKIAILMASSTNPREYVQRLGRVLRQSPDKAYAEIYDIIIKPDYKKLNDVLISFEKSIFTKEMVRAYEIAENALNNAHACKLINDVIQG